MLAFRQFPDSNAIPLPLRRRRPGWAGKKVVHKYGYCWRSIQGQRAKRCRLRRGPIDRAHGVGWGTFANSINRFPSLVVTETYWMGYLVLDQRKDIVPFQVFTTFE